MRAQPPGFNANHADTPALIMGNGPSLSNVDFEALSGYATFGMNAAYRYWCKIHWWPDYYSCLDLVVGDSHREEIERLILNAGSNGIRQFLLRHRLIKRFGRARRSQRISCYEELLAEGVLPKLADVTTGSHTMLWAESLGFATLLLAGVDCDYVERVDGAVKRGRQLMIESSRANPNYFFRDYQRPGDRYSVPNLSPGMHVQSWRNCRRWLKPGTVVINLNPDSSVDAFPKNTGATSFMVPSSVGPPTFRSNESTSPDEDFRELQKLVIRLRKFRSRLPLTAVTEHLRRCLNPGSSTLIDSWRNALKLPAIRLHGPGDPGPQIDEEQPYLAVTVRQLGDIELELHWSNTAAKDGNLQYPTILLYDAHMLPQLRELLVHLHEGLVCSSKGHALPAKLLKRSIRRIKRWLPLRLRVMNYRRILHFPHRISPGRIARSRSTE